MIVVGVVGKMVFGELFLIDNSETNGIPGDPVALAGYSAGHSAKHSAGHSAGHSPGDLA